LPSLLNRSAVVSRDSLNSNSAGLGFLLYTIRAAPTENSVSQR
jgi:hypothetical protein